MSLGWRWIVASTCAAVLVSSEVGCSSGVAYSGRVGAVSNEAGANQADGGAESAEILIQSDGGVGDAEPVVSLATSPLTLFPSFSPDVEDYYVLCSAGANALSVRVTDALGTTTTPTVLVEGQAALVRGQYWIRCLPHDFPTITVAHPSGGQPTPGYYLLNTASYAIALDVRGTPIWYAHGTSVGNVDAQRPNTISLMPAGTAPYGTSLTAPFELHALGTQTTTFVQASGGPTDGHELRWLANGDFLLFTYPTEAGVDLTGLESLGANQTIADCEVQEIDPSGRLVWSWRASDHVDPVLESLEPASNAMSGQAIVDAYHCNAIDVDAAGNLLVSMRHTNAVFYVDKSTGKVLWKLGGSPYSKDGAECIRVVDDPEGTFQLQHDARFLPNGDISLFDDHGASPGVARGVEYALDFEEGTAAVVWQFLGTTPSQYEGSFRRYDDGESVIGWGGSAPDPRVVTEVDENGDDVLDVAFAPAAAPYRAVKVPVAALDINLMRQTAGRW